MSSKKSKKQPINVESDSDSDMSQAENETNETSVDVGLIDDYDPKDLNQEELDLNRILVKSPFFPSKVGGKPAWLDYTNLPLSIGSLSLQNKDDNNNKQSRIVLDCDTCKSQLTFLLQIYAPIDKNIELIEDIDKTFHRCLYVFICNNFDCKNKTTKVLRSQLSRESVYFSYEAPPTLENGDQDLELSKEHLKKFYKGLYEQSKLNLCSVCGLISTKKCSKCNFAFYCCQSHQLHDWTKLNHKNLCVNYGSTVDSLDDKLENWINDEISEERYKSNEKCEFLFPEYEIIIEPETLDYKKKKKLEKDFQIDEKKIVQELENDSNDGTDNDFDQIKENDYDKDFEKFKLRSAPEPTQIVRYDRGGKPLWCTKYGKLKQSQIPKCENCGSNRIFEFQITPQLLNYLNLDVMNQIAGNCVDWAGLYVYTCVKSCTSAHNSYAIEYVYKQDFIK